MLTLHITVDIRICSNSLRQLLLSANDRLNVAGYATKLGCN